MALYSDRSCPPEATLARIASSLTRYGITRLARLTDLDRVGIPVWNAIAPNSRSIVVNQGKGILDIDAKVSAAMEALERSVAGDPAIPKRDATLRQLDQDGVRTDPLPNLIAAGYSDILPDETLSWTPGSDILAGREVWVPLDAVLLDDTRPNRFWQSSDGLASGNTLLEATFHGLLERIERDAEALSQFASDEDRRKACIDVHSFEDPVLSRLAGRVTEAGFQLQMFDLTTDVGIPCFEALIAPAGGEARYIEVTQGAGAHLSPVRAAIRAVTEAAQSRLTYISGARDDIAPETFDMPLPVHLSAALRLRPNSYSYPSLAGLPDRLDDMLAVVLARLSAVGIGSVIVVDMAPAEGHFSVAKVLVSALESPDGTRKRRLGARALRKVLNSR